MMCSLSISNIFIPLQSKVEMVNGVLMIHSVNQSDAGMYQCLAENKYGAIYASAELKILGMQFLNKSVGRKHGFFPCSNSPSTKVL